MTNEDEDDMSIALHHAWGWNCPKCSERNYNESVRAPLSDAEVRSELGMEDWEEVTDELRDDFTMAPQMVTCRKCEGSFMAHVPVCALLDDEEDFDDEDDDEGDELAESEG